MPDPRPVLHICTTCRAGETSVEGAPVPGRRLFDRVAALLADDNAPVSLRSVVCLGNCEQGCSAAVEQAGKWTYLLGRLEPAMGADLLAYAATYAAHPTGTVLPSRRPASLARVVLGRMPDLSQRSAA